MYNIKPMADELLKLVSQIKRNKSGHSPYDLNNHGMSKHYTKGTPYDLNVAGFSKKNKSL